MLIEQYLITKIYRRKTLSGFRALSLFVHENITIRVMLRARKSVENTGLSFNSVSKPITAE